MSVRLAKTQISLGIRPVWSESSLCAQWVAKDPRFLHPDSEDSDQTGRMPRLIWVFAGRIPTFLVLSWGGSFSSSTTTNIIIIIVIVICYVYESWSKSLFLFLIQRKVRILSKFCDVNIEIEYISSNWILFEKQLWRHSLWRMTSRDIPKGMNCFSRVSSAKFVIFFRSKKHSIPFRNAHLKLTATDSIKYCIAVE